MDFSTAHHTQYNGFRFQFLGRMAQPIGGRPARQTGMMSESNASTSNSVLVKRIQSPTINYLGRQYARFWYFGWWAY